MPEQVVADAIQRLKLNKVTQRIDGKWLIHVPQLQLNDLVYLVEDW